jgi:hypothetical protein
MAVTNPAADDTLNPEQKARVEAELTRGEQVLWMGTITRPKHFAARLVVIAVLYPVVTALLVGAVVAPTWYFVGSGYAAAGVVGLGLGCYGLALVLLPFFLLYIVLVYYWKPPLYAVTSKRALIWSTFAPRVARSYYPAQLQTMYRREGWGGRGSLIFEQKRSLLVLVWRVGFLDIPHVREVERLIRERLLGG